MSGATEKAVHRKTERLKRKQKNSNFLFCLLSCEPHKVQTTAEFKVSFECWLYQWRKLSVVSWASGVFWGHTVDYASYSISALYFPSGYWWGLNNLTGQEREGYRESSWLSSFKNKMQGEESVSKPNWQGKITYSWRLRELLSPHV